MPLNSVPVTNHNLTSISSDNEVDATLITLTILKASSLIVNNFHHSKLATTWGW